MVVIRQSLLLVIFALCISYTLQGTDAIHYPTRKFSLSKFFHGLANTCLQLCGAFVAHTPTEKQQAALGVIGSVLHLAGELTAKDNVPQGVVKDNNNQTAHRAIELTTRLLEGVQGDNNSLLSSTTTPLLWHIAALGSREAQEQVVHAYVTSPDLSKIFFREVFQVLNSYITLHVPQAMEGMQQQIVDACTKTRALFMADTRSGEPSEVALTEQVGEVVHAVYGCMHDLLAQNKVGIYVKDQLLALVGYLHEKLLGNEDLAGNTFVFYPD